MRISRKIELPELGEVLVKAGKRDEGHFLECIFENDFVALGFSCVYENEENQIDSYHSAFSNEKKLAKRMEKTLIEFKQVEEIKPYFEQCERVLSVGGFPLLEEIANDSGFLFEKDGVSVLPTVFQILKFLHHMKEA